VKYLKKKKPDLTEEILKKMVSEKLIFSDEDFNLLDNMIEASLENTGHVTSDNTDKAQALRNLFVQIQQINQKSIETVSKSSTNEN